MCLGWFVLFVLLCAVVVFDLCCVCLFWLVLCCGVCACLVLFVLGLLFWFVDCVFIVFCVVAMWLLLVGLM